MIDRFNAISATRLSAISFMSRAELLLWPKANNWGALRTAELHSMTDDFVTLYPDEETCELWSRVRDDAGRKGRPIDVADAWIAATALQFALPLLTRNARDFEFIDDLELIPL